MKDRKSYLALILLFCSGLGFQSSALATVETVLGDLPIRNNQNLPFAVPLSLNPEIIISRPQYVISYNKERRTPNWVAWKLDSKQIGKSGRANLFDIDPDLEKYLKSTNPKQHAVSSAEYTGSCFDRGHQAPSSDRSDTLVDNQATFFMSNMIPQNPYLNRVIWEHLEQHTRNLVATENKYAYIIAGPIYDKNFGAIGPKSDIQVPSKDFKVIVFLDKNQTANDIHEDTEMIAVIMPNTYEDGSRQISGAPCKPFSAPPNEDVTDWQKYQTTIDQIEQLSGIKLFPKKTN